MRRHLIFFVDILTYMAIGPLLIFLFIAAGLMISLALVKLVINDTDATPVAAATQTWRYVSLPETPASAKPVSHLTGTDYQPEIAALVLQNHTSQQVNSSSSPLARAEIAARSAAPTPTPTRTRSQQSKDLSPSGLITRLIAVIMSVFSKPAATPIVIRHLPTLTPTPLSDTLAQMPGQPDAVAVVPDGAAPSSIPTATMATPIPALTSSQSDPAISAPAPPPSQNEPEPFSSSDSENQGTSSSGTPGWSFAGVPSSLNEGQTIIMGVLINHTDAPQEAVEISGHFYNAQGQVIQDQIDMSSYVPVDIIPVGAHVPFELDVESPETISRFELLASSTPATSTPRQDFRLTDVKQWTDQDGMYCLGGQVENSGASQQDYYLVILITIYNNQGKLVNFSDGSTTSSDDFESGQFSPFEICLDPLSQQIARYEISAVGY